VIYAQTFYLDIACESWKALVWPSIPHPEIIMPLPVRRKFGLVVVYHPLFCQYLGLFSLRPLSDFQFKSFIRFLSHRFSYVSAYHFSPENSVRMSALTITLPGLKFTQNHTHWLRTDLGYWPLYSGYSNDRKRNLRRSRDCCWHVQKSNDVQPLLEMFRENQAARIKGGVNPEAFMTLGALVEDLQARELIELYYACADGHIHAGILLVKFAGRVIYLFNAADHKGRLGNARTFMLDEYFQKDSGKSLIFDFESPEVDSIASFYKSFGAEPILFYSMAKNELWFPLKQMQNWRKYFFKTRPDLF
jgi:hypothetical protein